MFPGPNVMELRDYLDRASSAVRIASAHCLGAVTEVSTSTSYSRNVCTRAC